MKKGIRIVSRKRFITFAVIVVLTSAFIVSTILGFNEADSLSMREYNRVTVSNDDTIWEIASEYAPDDKDIRQVVYEICNINNVSASTLEPGQELVIPVYY